MTKQQILFLVLGVSAGIFLIALIIISVRLYKIKKRADSDLSQTEDVKTVGGVRYTKSSEISDGEEMKITHLPEDVILARGKTYLAVSGKREKDMAENELPSGVYTALSAEGNSDSFKIRVGGLVKSFSHGNKIVLGEGEEICAVSCAVILR